MLNFFKKKDKDTKINKKTLRLDNLKHQIELTKDQDINKLLAEHQILVNSYTDSFIENSLELVNYIKALTNNYKIPKDMVISVRERSIIVSKLFYYKGSSLDADGTFKSFIETLEAFTDKCEISFSNIEDNQNENTILFIIEHYIEQLKIFNHILHR